MPDGENEGPDSRSSSFENLPHILPVMHAVRRVINLAKILNSEQMPVRCKESIFGSIKVGPKINPTSKMYGDYHFMVC